MDQIVPGGRLELSVCEGKYTFIMPANDYRCHILRYGKPWLILKEGSKAIDALIFEALEMKERLNKYEKT